MHNLKTDIETITIREAFSQIGLPALEDSPIYGRGDASNFSGEGTTWGNVFGHMRDDGRMYWFLEDPSWAWHRNKWVEPLGEDVGDQKLCEWPAPLPEPLDNLLNGIADDYRIVRLNEWKKLTGDTTDPETLAWARCRAYEAARDLRDDARWGGREALEAYLVNMAQFRSLPPVDMLCGGVELGL